MSRLSQLPDFLLKIIAGFVLTFLLFAGTIIFALALTWFVTSFNEVVVIAVILVSTFIFIWAILADMIVIKR